MKEPGDPCHPRETVHTRGKSCKAAAGGYAHEEPEGRWGGQGRNGSGESGSQDRRQETRGWVPALPLVATERGQVTTLSQPSLICKCSTIVIMGCNCRADRRVFCKGWWLLSLLNWGLVEQGINSEDSSSGKVRGVRKIVPIGATRRQ